MKRLDRRPLLLNTAVGVLMTLVVIGADWQGRDGFLAPLERRLFDVRARECQFFTPPPTDKLVHVDIDDASLQAIGAWPWRRSLLAELTDEMRIAGAKAVAFDVLFPEAQEATHVPVDVAPVEAPSRHGGESGAPSRQGGAVPAPNAAPYRDGAPLLLKGVFERVDENERFAEALRLFGNAMLPAAFEPLPPASSLRQRVKHALIDDLSLGETELAQRLRSQGARWSDPVEFSLAYTTGRADALYHHMTEALAELDAQQSKPPVIPTAGAAGPPASPSGGAVVVERSTSLQLAGVPSLDVVKEQLRRRLGDKTGSIPGGALKEQYIKAAGFLRLRRLTRDVSPDTPPVLPVYGTNPPLPQFSQAMKATSYVNYLGDPDGTVRIVPLWQNHEGRLYPQFGLMLACMMLDVDMRAIELAPDQMAISLPDGGRIEVPVFSVDAASVGQRCDIFAYVPTFGSGGANAWMTMYDHPRYLEARQHLSIVKVWEVIDLRQQTRRNCERIDDALKSVYHYIDPDIAERIDKKPSPPGELQPRAAMVDELFKNAKDLDDLTGGVRTMTAADFDKLLAEQSDEAAREDMRKIRAGLLSLPVLVRETRGLAGELEQRRRFVASELKDKAIIVGWTAAGRIDIVNTSLQPNCPGPVVHGMIFNAIMTGEFWRQGSPWATRGLTLLVGALATLIVVRTGPAVGLLAAVLLAAAYGVVNGVLFFDYHNLVLGAAAPLTAIAVVWAGCSLTRTILERAERKLIESKFRSYADPALVNYIVEHRDSVKLDGQVREMTVVFTDLAGFTTLNETLKEKTVGILNEYLGRMVPIIKDPQVPLHRQGYVNKFLGDGIMFFFNAPVGNDFHAADAVATVLKMQRSVVEFNEWLYHQDLPAVKMRAGICTGDMVVGNAGTADRADYTVLGDNVNLASRLEGANKATGTLVLIHERTAELSRDLILSRPIARLQVVGKEEGVMTYEPLCYREEATDEQRKLVEMTEAMVNAFISARFEDCLGHVAQLDEAFGASKLTAMYRAECEANLAVQPGEAFDGNIRLTEK